MPRPRKSAKLLSISGSFERNPKRRRKDVIATGEVGPWREWSTDPATVWSELVAGCPAGAAADRAALEYTVHLLVEMRRDPAAFSASKGATLVSLLSKLGCTPASRLQMSAHDPKTSDDPAEKYFR